MKTSLLILLLAISASISYSQDSDTIQFPQLIAGGGHNFQVIGDKSFAYRDSLFSHFDKKPGKRYIWQFKNVEIPGISEPVTLQVHQGVKGYTTAPRYDANWCGGESYFYTFTSEKLKKRILKNQNEFEYPGLVIYVRKGRNYGVAEGEVEHLEAYLRSIYEG